MAIITPLKKIFNWQLAGEKIQQPSYKVYAAYVTVDAGNNFSAYRVLENTIGNVTFATSGGEYQILLPDFYPRHNIAIPGFTDFWADSLSSVVANNNNPTYRFQMFPGFSGPGYDDPTNSVFISLFSDTGVKNWIDFFGGSPGDTTSVFIEIRVYN